jgi:hypothetical protein
MTICPSRRIRCEEEKEIANCTTGKTSTMPKLDYANPDPERKQERNPWDHTIIYIGIAILLFILAMKLIYYIYDVSP